MRMVTLSTRVREETYNILLNNANLRNCHVSELTRRILERAICSIDLLEAENQHYLSIIERNKVLIQQMKEKEEKNLKNRLLQQETNQKLQEGEEKIRKIHKIANSIFKALMEAPAEQRNTILEDGLSNLPDDEKEAVKKKLDIYKKHLDS